MINGIKINAVAMFGSAKELSNRVSQLLMTVTKVIAFILNKIYWNA